MAVVVVEIIWLARLRSSVYDEDGDLGFDHLERSENCLAAVYQSQWPLRRRDLSEGA